MQAEDLEHVVYSAFPMLSLSLRTQLCRFNALLAEKMMIDVQFMRKGRPWEFNLRDVVRYILHFLLFCIIFIFIQNFNFCIF